MVLKVLQEMEATTHDRAAVPADDVIAKGKDFGFNVGNILYGMRTNETPLTARAEPGRGEEGHIHHGRRPGFPQVRAAYTLNSTSLHRDNGMNHRFLPNSNGASHRKLSMRSEDSKLQARGKGDERQIRQWQ